MLGRKMVVVVSAGEAARYEQVLRQSGHEVMAMRSRTFEAQMQICTEEFKRGIALAIVHGISMRRTLNERVKPTGMSDVDRIAERLKDECEGIKVIVMSNEVNESICEVGRAYDVVIPCQPADLRAMTETFLGFEEY